MKITESNRDRLVIKDFPWALGLIMGPAGGALVCFGVKALVFDSGSDKAMGVNVIVGALFILAGAVFTKRSVFTFDLNQQQLVWSRLSLFGWKGGTVPFGRITGCIVQGLSERGQVNSKRLALAIPEGDVPLTESYSTGSDAERQKMRAAIHAAIGLPAPEQETYSDDDVKALIGKGQVIAAIKLIREQRGIGLREAKDLVDGMWKEAPESGTTSGDDVKALIDKGQVIAAIKLIREQRGISIREAKDVVDGMGKNG